MAVALQEVVAVLAETQHRLRVIAPDHPGREALEASLADLRLLHKWLTSETTASSAADPSPLSRRSTEPGDSWKIPRS